MGRLRSLGAAHARAAVAFFFLAVLALGLLTTAGYGNAWDDLSEMNILRMALLEYDALCPTPLGDSLRTFGLPRLSQSVERDHGICLYYPLFWAVSDASMPPARLRLIWRSYTWALFTLGLFALYAVARRLGLSRGFACLGVLIVLLSPRFFAEGHYNNKDLPLMAAILGVIWQSARLMERPVFRRALGLALLAGLCVSTRIVGAAYCALMGGMVLLGLWRTGRLNARTLGVCLFSALMTALLYALFTPCLLTGPVEFVHYLLQNAVGFSRWHGDLLFLGRVISCSQMNPPRLYLPVMIAVTTPLWALLLLGVGTAHALRGLPRALSTPAALLRTALLAGWAMPLCAMVALRPLVYNGWRHAYFLYGPMALGMADGLHALWQRLRAKRLLACLTALCLALSAVGIAVHHPFQYAYYNALVPRDNRARLFEMDWWNLSCENALRQLVSLTGGQATVRASDERTRSGLVMATRYPGLEGIEVVREGPAQYLIANLSYAAMDDFVPTGDLVPVVTISSYGSPVTVIYELKGEEAP